MRGLVFCHFITNSSLRSPQLAESGVNQWKVQNRAVKELMKENPWFEPMTVTLGKGIVQTAAWGLMVAYQRRLRRRRQRGARREALRLGGEHMLPAVLAEARADRAGEREAARRAGREAAVAAWRARAALLRG